jgi:hypothetical protein
MDFNNAWLRRDTVGTASIYYGYAVNVASTDTDRVWSIRKISTTSNSSVVDTVTWSDNEMLSYNGKWSERVANFTTPSGSLGITYSKTTDTFSNVTINTTWTILSGVNTYKVTITDQNGVLYGSVKTPRNQVFLNNYGGERITDRVVGNNGYNFIGTTGMTYSLTITGVNTIGTTASTVTITT